MFVCKHPHYRLSELVEKNLVISVVVGGFFSLCFLVDVK